MLFLNLTVSVSFYTYLSSSLSFHRLLSQSKPITAVGVMILVERGLLKLEDNVSQYIPSFTNMEVFVGTNPDGSFKTVPADKPITILHLLTHTSGLSYGQGIASYISFHHMSMDDYLKLCYLKICKADTVQFLNPGKIMGTYSVSLTLEI